MCSQPAQYVIIEDISVQKVVGVSISIRERILLILLSILHEMIIRMCMCKGQTGHTNGPNSKQTWLTADQHNIVLPFTDKLERAI